MKKNNKLYLFSFFLILCSCSWQKEEIPYIRSFQPTYGNEQNNIILQNQTNRIIVNCQSTDDVSADSCARAFESKGYVRLADIPYKTANYDFLKTDTYPTRRWRGSEYTPRW